MMYKVFDIKNGAPHFLFHGLKRTRKAEVGKWMKAEEKPVTDGSCATIYTSGFHCFPSIQSIREWAKQVTHIDDRVVVKVQVKKTQPKSHAKTSITLASQLLITHQAWSKRKPLCNVV